MKIFLKELNLTNFKGQRSLAVKFDSVTNIYGDNATGKTTLMDAFLWLFFGKDSTDRKDFEIKTLDAENNPYHKLDHEVAAVVMIDGEEINIRRSLKEKWETPRGSKEQIFKGHTTSFYWNDVPLKEADYQAKIAGIINESLFKLLTNTTYFNSLKWQDRRSVLMLIGGSISHEDIMKSLAVADNKGIDFSPIIAALKAKKSLKEYRAEIGAKKSKLKSELEQLPARIDEANRSLPAAVDAAQLENDILEESNNLLTVQGLLESKSGAAQQFEDAKLAKVNELGDLKLRQQEIEFEEKNKAAQKKLSREQVIITKKNDLRMQQQELDRLQVELNSETKRKEGLEIIREDLRKKWYDIDGEKLVFDEDEFKCPACQRLYETQDIEAKKEELTKNFNANKSNRLKEITENGNKKKAEIETIVANINVLTNKIEVAKSETSLKHQEIKTLEENNLVMIQNDAQDVANSIAENTEYKGILEIIRLREEEVATPVPVEDKSELLQRKKEIISRLDELKAAATNQLHRAKTLARIDELQTQEAKTAQELATLEGIEFAILKYEKAEMETLENRINDRFKIVQFKMFETQINGGEVPTCITLIGGVPYPDANKAAQIQAGLDIINTLGDHYGVEAPVWVDNRESIVRLPETKAQLINLIVSPNHKKLTVGKPQMELEMA